MFQIVCALALEVPAVLLELRQLKGVSPNATIACEPWGHMNHDDGGCECLSSDRTGAYVHELVLAASSRDLISDSGASPHAVSSGLSGVPGDRDADFSSYDGSAHSVAMHLGSVPYVFHRPRAYSRLLSAVYERWQTGLLAASDWLKPVNTWGLACGYTNHHGGVG